MFFQVLVVAVLVVGCTAYAAWTLMPAPARRALARTLLAWRLPAPLQGFLRKHASATGGCACGGCDHGAKAQKPARTQPIQFHPRPKSRA